ncbi:MAG: LuxR C-terminal-related transcriptional regulator, partial [Anaerolineales bacterium]
LLFKEVEKLVERAQPELTERDREMWNYVHNGLDDEEIAERMGIKVRTVQVERSALYKKIVDIVRRMIGEQ